MAVAARARAVVLAVALAACGLVGSTAVGGALREGQRERATDRMERSSRAVQLAVDEQLARYLDAVRSTAAALTVLPSVTGDAYAEITAPVLGQRLAGASAITFVVPSEPRSFAATTAYWRDRGAHNLTLRPTSHARQHLFTIFSRGLGGDPPRAPGRDVAAAPAAMAAAQRAHETRQVTISDAYVLLVDSDLPAAQQQLSFVVAAPVFRPGARILGYVMLGIRGTRFMATTLYRAARDTLDAQLLTRFTDGRMVPVAAVRQPGSRRADLGREVTIQAGGRHWTLRTSADYGLLMPVASRIDLAVTIAGGLLSLAFGLLVLVQAQARRRAEVAVRRATAELRVAEQRARDQAALLSAAVAGTSDGIAVVDADGRHLLRNPAYDQLLGDGVAGRSADATESVGIFRADGITPLPADELPLTRAAAGEEVANVPVVIRNEHHPDGIAVTMSARPLDPVAGRPGAVGMVRDVTERSRAEQELGATTARLRIELARRHTIEAELRDARDQLTEQKAYLVQVLEALRIAVVTCDGQGRVVHANRLARESALTEGLPRTATELGATGGARHPDVAPVDLDALIREVLEARVCALLERPGNLPPEATLGPLPVVYGDAGMLRQLVNNLIGNAMRYPRAGEPARIEVTARPDERPGLVRIDIGDRGIGVPPGQHEAIFIATRRR